MNAYKITDLPAVPPVGGRCDPEIIFKCFTEVSGIQITELFRNFINTKVCFQKKGTGLFHFFAIIILHGRNSIPFLEHMTEMIFVHGCIRTDLFKCKG